MKLIKRVSILGMVLMLAVTGCGIKKGGELEQGGNKSNSDEMKYPKKMTIARTLYYGDSGDELEKKQNWPKVMEEKYGIEFEVVSPPRNSFMEKVNLMVTSGELTGMLNLFGPEDVMSYMNSGAIEPLDEYLVDNEVWNSLPQEMREMYKFDGKTWAVPMGCTPTMFTRSIRKDWLDRLGLNPPETIEEFYEVMRAFTYDDPDGNGVDDTVGLTSSNLWNLQDIFQAFDARLNDIGEGSLAWDPNRECYNDSMLNPGMIDALKYLNKMYQEGILDNELFTNKGNNMREKIFSGKYGSSFYWLHWGQSFQKGTEKNVPEAKFIELPYLKGTINKKLNHVCYNGNPPYVLISGTEQPKEVVNAFVDIFFGDIEGNLMGRYGIPGVNYEFKEGTIYIKQEDGMSVKTAGLIQPIPIYDERIYPTYPENATQLQLDEIKASEQLKQEIMYDKLESGELYMLGNTQSVTTSEKYYETREDIIRIFNEAIVNAITGISSPEEAIEGYREKMKKLGAQQVLDEANKALGTECSNSY